MKNLQGAQRLFGIIGHPLGHSLSPALHSWGFARAGLAAVYMAWPITPDKLEDFFKAVRLLPVHGGNITLPHKVAAMPLLDALSSRATAVGAVNTFYWDKDVLRGENTDVTGFIAPIRKLSCKSALVLGAGGAARALLAGLKELGVPDIAVCNRSPAAAASLAAEFGVHCLAWQDRGRSGADMLVNATSLGMLGKTLEESPFPGDAFKGRGLAYDIVYNPLKTRFLKEAEAAGWRVQGGLDMFVEQARESFRLWTGGRDLPGEGAARLLRESLLS